MKQLTKLTLTILLSTIVVFSYSQEDKKKTRAERKAEKEQRKLEEKKKVEAQWVKDQEMAKNQNFIVEFTRVTDNRTGTVYNLTPRTNFIAVNGNRVVIQVETNVYLADNGLGGITIDGDLSDYKYNPPEGKKGTIQVSFNVSSQSTFRGSNVTISVGKEGYTTVTIGSSPMIFGNFVSPEESKITVGGSFWN